MKSHFKNMLKQAWNFLTQQSSFLKKRVKNSTKPEAGKLLTTEIKPYFIITAGATGSGKTGLIQKTMKYLHIENEPFVRILVDELVENDDKYKSEVKHIIDSVTEECKNEGKCTHGECYRNCEENKYKNPSAELYKQFSDAYFTTRKQRGCMQNPDNLTCDNLNDQNLKDATSTSKHIIFEFTGSYIPDWLLDPSWIPDQYAIVTTYSLVTFDNLVKRNKSRAYLALQAFKENDNLPAPRVPNVSYDTFERAVSTIYAVLCKLYELCILNYTTNIKTCGKRKISQLILFDNNGESLVNIFDSTLQQMNKDDFIKLITNHFGLSE
jgi:hypothetical protein